MSLNYDKVKMVARSMHAYERLFLLKNSPLTSTPSDTKRLKDWIEVCANGDDDKFKQRLSQDGITENQAKAILNIDNLDLEKLSIPEWIDFYDEVITNKEKITVNEVFQEGDSKQPFFHVVYPFYKVALQKLEVLQAKIGLTQKDIPLKGPLNYFKRLLTDQASQVLNLEFNIYKTQQESGFAAILRRASNDNQSDRIYRDFITNIYENSWDDFFSEYIVMTRLLCQVSINWIKAISSFLERYHSDLEDLQKTLNNNTPFGSITKIDFGLSDRHNGGKTTAIIHFDSGSKIVYKPKPLGTENVLAAIVDWHNKKSNLIDLKTVPILHRNDYGWQAFVENKGCKTEEEVKRFYVRAGYLMAIVYILEGYDYHYENLIAEGEYPYLIDTETIFNPYKEMEVVKNGELNAAIMASETVFYSVLRTGMLPNWNVRSQGEKKDISGFGGSASDNTSEVHTRRWQNIGTDDIELTQVTIPIAKMGNQPYIEGQEPVITDRYVPEITKGFQDMYNCIMQQKDDFKKIIQEWNHIKVRFVRKPTRAYANLIWKLSKPEYLRDGMDWSICTEKMAQLFLAANLSNHEQWNLLREEYASLIQSDIPYFSAYANELDIRNGNNDLLVNSYFTTKCFDRLTEKLDRLSATDLALQERYIQYAFYAKAAKSFHDNEDGMKELLVKTKNTTTDLHPISKNDCINIAKDVAIELEKEALKASDGSMAWIALEYLKEVDVFQFKPISYNLYSGATGIGFFLGSLYKITKDKKYHDFTRAAMAPIMRIVDKELDELIRFSGIGGGIGLGSLIYGFASIASFLESTPFGEEAKIYALKCAEKIDNDALKTDKKYDVIFGSAGLLLGLIKLYKITEDTTVKNKVLLTANYLLSKRTNTEQGDNLIPTYGKKVITGISHGASGIALALLKAYEITGIKDFKNTALAHIKFEEQMYDNDACNYPSYQSTETEKLFLSNWCHGAPGIGLTRLLAYKVTNDEYFLQQINKNIKVATDFSLNHLDHICCGNFGRLDIQLEYANLFKDNEKLINIRKDAKYISDRFKENNGFRLFIDAPTKVFSPGLFVGATGIAYSLLRIAYPDQLPSVLAYE